MEAAYEILLVAARLMGVALVLFVALSIGIRGVRAVSRQRRQVDELRARVALAEREVRNGLRGAAGGMHTARTQLTSALLADAGTDSGTGR